MGAKRVTDNSHSKQVGSVSKSSPSVVVSDASDKLYFPNKYQARGMNYLHRHNPPILHLDLKSSNLLVDNNWTMKPQWMSPEILRNEQADEKSDVYSYGVVLWEIITTKIPWNDLNPTQVIAVVGFKNQN